MQLQTKIQPWFEAYDTMVLKAFKKETKTRIIKYPNPTCFSCFLAEIVWNRTCLVVKSIEILLPACFLIPPLLLVTLKLCPPPMWLCLRHARMRPLGSIAPALFTKRKKVGTLQAQKKDRHFSVGNVSKKKSDLLCQEVCPTLQKKTPSMRWSSFPLRSCHQLIKDHGFVNLVERSRVKSVETSISCCW